jgi:hypothetical protein
MKAAELWKTAGAVLLLVALAAVTVVTRERARTRAWLTGLGDQLQTLRVSADSCQGSLAHEEADFMDYDRRVDSLREEVRGFEDLDPRGVPGESYDDYMARFQDYNSSVPEWRERADTLRARWDACRVITEEHNVLADSLQRALRERDGAS